jgi:hypothetical protein
MIQKQEIDTLKSFYGLMEKTHTVWAAIVKRILSLQPCEQKQIGDLKKISFIWKTAKSSFYLI